MVMMIATIIITIVATTVMVTIVAFASSVMVMISTNTYDHYHDNGCYYCYNWFAFAYLCQGNDCYLAIT